MINIVGLMTRIFFSLAPSNLFVRAEIGFLGIFVQQQMKRVFKKFLNAGTWLLYMERSL